MKILVINPNSDAAMTAAIQRSAEAFAQGSFEVRTVSTPGAPTFIESHASEIQCGPGMLGLMEEYEGDYDAFVIACYSDPGLQVCREATTKPVFGINECAVLTALAKGDRFGVLAIKEASVRRHVRYLRQMGLIDRLAGERPLDMSVAETASGADTLARMVEVGRELRDHDGADVVVMDNSPRKLVELDALYGPRLKTIFSTEESVADHVEQADLVIGAVLIPGAAAPKLVRREMLVDMKRGAVVVDVAIDQGGCFETSRPTTHEDPVYIVDDVVHYCVANMPGAVPRTSTYALSNATLPYIVRLANQGILPALAADPALRKGVNTYQHKITYPSVAEAFGLEYTPLDAVL